MWSPRSALAKARLYRHYASRNELFAATLRANIDALVSHCREVWQAKEANPFAAFCAVIGEFVRLNHDAAPLSPATLTRLQCSGRWADPDDQNGKIDSIAVALHPPRTSLADCRTAPSGLGSWLGRVGDSGNRRCVERRSTVACLGHRRRPAHRADAPTVVHVRTSANGGPYRGLTPRPQGPQRQRPGKVSRMGDTVQLLLFRLDHQRYALPLATVEHVVQSVEVTPLPHAPTIVLGAINVHGQVLPVLNVRRRFLLSEREVVPTDWFLIAHTARRTVVLVVDQSDGLVERPRTEIIPSSQVAPGLDAFPGVVRLDDGLVLIHDLDQFLSLDEARTLDDAIDDFKGA